VLTIQFEENGMPSFDGFTEELVQPRRRPVLKTKAAPVKPVPNDWRTLNREKKIDLDAVIGNQEERIEQARREQKLREQKLEEMKKQQRKSNIEL